MISLSEIIGGGERDRTDDLLLAKQALSQLSYTPDMTLVGLVGFEPTTPRLSSVCSDQLSYRPCNPGSRIEGRGMRAELPMLLNPQSSLLNPALHTTDKSGHLAPEGISLERR